MVAALRSKRGSSYRLPQRIGGGDWRLNISVALALEYEGVLKRRHVLPGFSETEVDEFKVMSVTISVPEELYKKAVEIAEEAARFR